MTKLGPGRAFYQRRIDDAWSPMLVKEVRQALRGRIFTIGFVAALVIAFVVCAGWSMDDGVEGATLSQSLFGWMSLAVGVLVPFAAFHSMSGEWDGAQLDLLRLTPLRPLQLAGGKLLSALVQSALFGAAFVPFLCLAFVARGVGLVTILVQVYMLGVAAFALSSCGLALGALGGNKPVRVIAMLSLAMICFWYVQISLLAFGRAGSTRLFESNLAALIFFTLWLGALGIFGLMAAMSRLAHPLVNSSTPARIVTSIGLGTMFVGMTVLGVVTNVNREDYAQMLTVVCVAFALPCAFFVTEPDELPRQRGHRRGILWSPGGGRGVVFLWVHLVALLVLGATAHTVVFSGGRGLDGFGAPAAAAFAVSTYLVLPSTLLRRFTASPGGRAIVRWSMPALVLVTTLGAPLLAFLVSGDASGLDHPLNPFWVIAELGDEGPLSDALARGYGSWTFMFGVLSGFAALPRVAQGIGEIRPRLFGATSAR